MIDQFHYVLTSACIYIIHEDLPEQHRLMCRVTSMASLGSQHTSSQHSAVVVRGEAQSCQGLPH